MYKVVLLFLILRCTITYVFANNDLPDTTKIIYNAKILTLPMSNNLVSNICEYSTLLNNKQVINASIINFTGFRNTIFIEISINTESFNYNLKGVDIKTTDSLFSEDYILAFYTKNNRFYRLRGFLTNEFEEYFNTYKLFSDSYEKKILDSKEFVHDYSIENIDLKCLMDSVKSKKKTSFTKYPCLLPNRSKMKFINQFPVFN